MAAASFTEVRNTSGVLQKLKAKLSGKLDCNATVCNGAAYLHISDSTTAFKNGKYNRENSRQITLNEDDVQILKGLMIGIEPKFEMIIGARMVSSKATTAQASGPTAQGRAPAAQGQGPTTQGQGPTNQGPIVQYNTDHLQYEAVLQYQPYTSTYDVQGQHQQQFAGGSGLQGQQQPQFTGGSGLQGHHQPQLAGGSGLQGQQQPQFGGPGFQQPIMTYMSPLQNATAYPSAQAYNNNNTQQQRRGAKRRVEATSNLNFLDI